MPVKGRTIRAALLASGLACAAHAQSGPLPLPFAVDKEAREISVVVDRGLTRTNNLPTRELREARLAMLDGAQIETDLLKRLADYGDTLAALRYVDVLMARGIEENASDVAYYASVAVGGGRVWALPEMVEAMGYLDRATEPRSRINQYIRVLYPHAWAGNALALEAVIDFNGEGRLFGPLSDATRARIEQALVEQGGGRGDLKLAIEILSDLPRTPEQVDRALGHLRNAAQSDHLAIATTASNLIRWLNDNPEAPMPDTF